ncbi:MAG: redox-regulated ATPase YchF [Planctomycetes bacterium]|nr:redox-regulated ATPase YchF [Planctomycetota bacterium]
MGFSLGIVGLPNVGKSALFNAISGVGAASANYPFTTIDPNKASVPVADERLETLAGLVRSPKVTPAHLEIVDIAGLVEGAHDGEGLGNQFLAHIREADAIAHVVRLFDAPDVVHIGPVDPWRDLRIVASELREKDRETLAARAEKAKRKTHAGDTKAEEELRTIAEIEAALAAAGVSARGRLAGEALAFARECFLLGVKPAFVVANIDESAIRDPSADPRYADLARRLEADGLGLVPISARIEEEIHTLAPEEQRIFMEEYGLRSTGLSEIVRTGYALLDLVTFYTFNENELRAWSIGRGAHAVDAAGKVHTDMAQGFIKADVVHYRDFVAHGSMARAREAGHFVTAGRDYVVQDGDILYIRFKV